MSENLPNRTLPVSKAASFLGVSAETLRRWDRKGILKPFRTKGGQRRYSLTNLEAYKSGERSAKTPLKISQAAAQLGVHPETLRRWERNGAIQAERTNGGQRRYTLDRLEQIAAAPPVPAVSQPDYPPQIPVRTMEQFQPRPSYRFLKLFAVVAGLLIAVLGWSQLSPLSRERLKRAFSPSVQVPIADVNDVMGYKLSESFEILGLRFKFPVDLPGLVTQTFTAFGDSVLNGARFLGTVFFGQGNDYFITPTGDASFNSVTSNTGEVTTLRVTNLTVTGTSTGTGGGGGGGPAEGGDADTLGGQVGSYYLDLDNETGTCTDCLTGVEIDESTLTISLSNADLLDGQTGSYYLDRANHTGTQTAATISDFNEVSQDSVGGILTDTTSVNFTYDDLGNLITADVLAGGVDHGSLGGLGDDDHPQYLLAAGTRALTGNWDAGSFEIRAETFESDVATGTAPLIVASTTLVTNLNADLLDGQTGSYYLDRANHTGTQTAATISDFNEVSQDSVGGILTDTTSVNFTYDDLGNLITADVLAGGVDHGSLGGLGDDDHPQYLLAAGTRALTGNWDAGSFEIRAETFESDVATGTAPLIVASTTLVTNLNADLLDGQTGSYYLDRANHTGTQTAAT